MPLYSFDIVDSGEVTRDKFGSECANDAEAREVAMLLLPDIARDVVRETDLHEIVARARNEQGEVVYAASITQAGTWYPERCRSDPAIDASARGR